MIFVLLSDKEVIIEIGNRIKTIRLSKNISQQRLADSIGCHRSTIQDIEKGKSITLTTFIAIIRELGMLNKLDLFIPDSLPISPKERFHNQKKDIRKRAR